MKIGDTEMEEKEQHANSQLNLCILDQHNIVEYEMRKQTLTQAFICVQNDLYIFGPNHYILSLMC
jgi:hypothetical protein